MRCLRPLCTLNRNIIPECLQPKHPPEITSVFKDMYCTSDVFFHVLKSRASQRKYPPLIFNAIVVIAEFKDQENTLNYPFFLPSDMFDHKCLCLF